MSVCVNVWIINHVNNRWHRDVCMCECLDYLKEYRRW